MLSLINKAESSIVGVLELVELCSQLGENFLLHWPLCISCIHIFVSILLFLQVLKLQQALLLQLQFLILKFVEVLE